MRKLDLGMNGVQASASATITPEARVTEGRLDMRPRTPRRWPPCCPERLAFLAHRAPGLWRAAAAVQVLGSGAPNELAMKITADLDDLRLEAQPTST